MIDKEQELRVENRYILKERYSTLLFEATIVEISPSKKYTKLKYMSGEEAWRESGDLVIVEELLK